MAGVEVSKRIGNNTFEWRRLGSPGDAVRGFGAGVVDHHAIVSIVVGLDAPRGDSAFFEAGRALPGLFVLGVGMGTSGYFGSPASAAEGAAFRGPASGASIVSPPGAGQVIRGSLAAPVFEGHGTTAAGSLTVPQGTWLQLPNAAFVPEAAAQSAAMNGTFPPGMARVIPPGGTAPNLVLHPPTPGMTVRPSSWQVTRPTLLQDMLEPNMGFCVWGACQ